MKQRKCRLKDACWGYSAGICEDCQTSEKIEKYVRENKKLLAENAELRARLEKAVELPCKVGDTIYEVYDKCDGHNCPYNGCSGQWRCHYEGERRCGAFIKIVQFDYCDIPFVNDTVFVSREAAEARLKEIKENNDDVRRI